ncbi:Radical SAM domain protein [Desulfatibacillum aliphaticivorans]|uniref:Radical SAM domain protein n=1 Tax=Desulfatibacillum aliphaticivorans TaxID=218208 RepID=B8FD03_DESAL|nr:radical SAM protein [Desulfatibacillum aliphaticivorans]ACL06434.1 Radical SAM domain protein [Desulfatibacillum aliphaticivorans]
MTKILLIKPTSGNAAHIQASPPLGLMYLASALKAQGGYDVRILDMRLHAEPMSFALKTARGMAPGIAGISAFSLESSTVHELAAGLKALPKPPMVIAGGPYPTSGPDDVLSDPNIDLAVLGEGEETFPAVVRFLESGQGVLEDIPGLAFRRDGKIVKTAPAQEIQNMDALAFPAWDLIDINAYAKAERFANVRKNRYMPVFTSRSCPYQCIYCHRIFGKGFRPRSPENVADEIEALVRRHGVREIEIVDDIFNLNAERAEAICDLIISRGLKIKISFPNAMRADLLNFRLLKKLKKAGVHFSGIAVETGSPRLQKLIKKNLDLTKVNESINMAFDLGITTVGFFMLGFPSETRDELLATVDFACRSRLNFATFFVVTPFEGTPLYDLCLPKLNKMGAPEDMDYHRNACNFSEVPDEEFFRIRHQAYRRFYSKAFSRIILSGAYKDVSLFQILRLSALRVL